MKQYIFAVVLLTLMGAKTICAQEVIDTKKYKFDMTTPEGFGFKQSEKEGFTKIEGYNQESETRINAYAFLGEIEKQGVYDFGVQESGIDKSSWEVLGEGEGENGFAWWEIFEATVGEKVMYAVVAKNAYSEVYYMFYALATPESYEKYSDQYLEWAMSCSGIE